ncbi:MAG: RsmB/NOP family class I SAM-dependent RNA methyltransferase [Proteobacteria bacterium]|nr:RsmB/NOP family class I SAM-dependent RNA methyltransferase [Pseudomonadota bacterium]
MMDESKSQERELARAVLRSEDLRRLILDLWQRTRIDWGFASDRLADAFRKARQLGSSERRIAAEALYGMIRHLRRIDEALRAGGLRTVTHAPDRERLLAYLVIEAGLPAEDAARHRPDLDWQAVADIDARLSRDSNPVRKLALRHSLPDWLAEALSADLGRRAEAVAAALNTRAPMTIRVNTLASSVQSLAAELSAIGVETAPGRYATSALHVVTRTNLFSLDLFRKGHFEAQDEGSQLIAELVAPPPRARVIDYCAGAGGKTLALAALMGNRGRIVATDVDNRKLAELRRRARRAGVSTAQTIVLQSGENEPFPASLTNMEGRAHRVLADVPCTGIGALRRNPEARWRLSPDDLVRLPTQQLEIAARAMSLVAPGGRLIYATCTVLRRENEEVVAGLLKLRPDFETMPIKAIWGADRARPIATEDGVFLSLDPARHGADGFFAAVLRRVR